MKGLDEFGLTKNQVRQILIGRKRKTPKVLPRYISDNVLKFGLVSDTHLCSKYEKLDELHTFYSICKKVGVRVVLHAGDLVDGSGRIYRGQLNEIHTYGAMRQADYTIKNYPQEEGIKTYFITGNHCDSFFKENGIDIGYLVAEKRKDMIYLGQYQADITLGKVKIRILHADGSNAYALSYRGQKIAEQIPSGQKPHILIIGHYHTSHFFWYRNMNIINAGAFQGQNSFLMRKGLNPAIGGWICETRLAKKDAVVAFQPCWIPFF